MERELGV